MNKKGIEKLLQKEDDNDKNSNPNNSLKESWKEFIEDNHYLGEHNLKEWIGWRIEEEIKRRKKDFIAAVVGLLVISFALTATFALLSREWKFLWELSVTIIFILIGLGVWNWFIDTSGQ